MSPEWIPQLADKHDVLQGINKKPGIVYPVLVPNTQGFTEALASGATEVAVFISASETFSQKNINCSIAESLQRYTNVLARAKSQGIPVRGYISCVFECPFEGAIAASKVQSLAATLIELGCYEVALGDTIGIATAHQAQSLINTVANSIPREKIAAHFHDTYGQGLANLYAVMEVGISTIDCSVAGIGGCPYALVSSGNVASEDVLYLLNGLGIQTGVDLDKLIRAGDYISQQLGRPSLSRVANALRKKHGNTTLAAQ